ncbi:MAG: TIGR02757 family protein [Bradymonadaceae bacterium]|nr:TIGR02757 family protein [Lujinxingiaceae bacterium]
MLNAEQALILKPLLEELIERSAPDERRSHDPVDLVWNYQDPCDQEVVALITSCLAYGRVSLLKRAVAQVLAPMGHHPAEFLRTFKPADLPELYDGFVYRMSRAADIADLLAGIAHVILKHGSLEQAYRHHGGLSHTEAASELVRAVRAARLRSDMARGLAYLLPDPRDGSSCKRLHLFFRWVTRGPDGIDLGIWTAVSPADLIMPLDTHTSRLCRYIGLTDRSTVDAKMALEVTDSLRLLDPDDPLRYDFALCHLGISGRCIHRRSAEHCPGCPIEGVCTL